MITWKKFSGDVVLTASTLNPFDLEELNAAISFLCDDGGYCVVDTKNSQYTLTIAVTLRRCKDGTK